MKQKILLLEDDVQLRKTLAQDFVDRNYDVIEAAKIEELVDFSFQFAVVDLRLGQDSGLMAVKLIKAQNPECRLVVLTGYASIATAVEAVKHGAINYLTKPISTDVLEKALKNELNEKTMMEVDLAPLSRHEHEYIEFVLSQNGRNISRSAKILGLHRQSLQRKLKKSP